MRFFMFLLGLTVILQVLDLMGKSSDILSGEGADYGALVEYVRLRMPQLLSQFTPFAALLGVIATLVALNQSSEVTVMKSIGLSAYHILAPVMSIGLIIAVLHFIFHETVVVKTYASLQYWEKNDYAANLPPPPTTASQAWMVDGSTIIEVDSITQSGRVLLLDNVNLYQRDQHAVLTSIAQARFATYTNGNWTLYDVNRFTLPAFAVTHAESEPWPIGIPADRFVALAVDPQQVSFPKLWRSAHDLAREGYPTAELRAALYHKIAGPLSSLLMPLLAAVAAFGLARGGHLFLRVVVAMALGFSYFVADNFMMAMGRFGAAPPILSAWAPFLLFTLLGLSVLFYTEE
ncbi:MAG: LPS export ABC transporter permease LptG [Alphaproteobacteria bacterium]|nr:MAG: LPS export ABC transporter permease LptG [Alphaproteobacteria bacterium]